MCSHCDFWFNQVHDLVVDLQRAMEPQVELQPQPEPEPGPEPEPAAQAPAGRFCARCERRTCVCICAALPAAPVPLRRCKVLMLQHWREDRKKKATGTVRLLKLCMAEADLSVLVDRMGMQQGETSEVSRKLALQRAERQQAMQRGEAGDRGCLTAAETADMFPELGRALGLLPRLPGSAAAAAAAAHQLPALLLFPGERSRELESVLEGELLEAAEAVDTALHQASAAAAGSSAVGKAEERLVAAGRSADSGHQRRCEGNALSFLTDETRGVFLACSAKPREIADDCLQRQARDQHSETWKNGPENGALFRRALIVVDGTWNQARQLLKRHGAESVL